MDFHEISRLNIFFKSVDKNHIPLNSDKMTVLHVKTNIHFWPYLAQFFIKWEMFQTNLVEKNETQIL
jgi:hypothetical protein